MPYLIGIDIGTQGIKGVLLDRDLRIVERVYTRHDYLRPKPNWCEHNAEKTWWNGFKNSVKKLLSKRSIPAEEIVGVGCSGISPCMLPLDKKDRPLRNAILYGIDTRSKKEVEEMTQMLGTDELLKHNKQPLSTQLVGPKILWYKKNEPEKFKNTRKIVTTSNYITYKLTDNFVLDHAQASMFAPFYNFNTREWDEKIIRLFNISPNIFPPLKKCYDIAGTITKKAAKETGLAKDTPVIASTSDGFAEIISTGSFGEGNVVLIYGATGVISITVSDCPVTKDLFISPHPILDNHCLVTGGTATAGALTKWFRDNFGDIEKIMQKRIKSNAYKLLSDQAKEIPLGSEGLLVLPFFRGERTPVFDPLARGVIIGLTTSHSRVHVYRALLEGIAYSFRHHFDIFKDYGFKISKVTACGRGTKSDLWVQIVTDTIGYNQFLPDRPTGSEIGVAILAAKAVGLIDDFQSLKVTSNTENVQKVSVNEENHRVYQKFYKTYLSLYRNVKDDMHKLAALS